MSKPEVVYVTYIRSTPTKVWDAITKPKFTRVYWGDMVNVSDWKKGSTWEHQATKKGNEVWVTGEVVESVPPKRLVLTWQDPDDLKDVSRVTIEIEKVAKLVKLKVVHDSFSKKSDMAAKVSHGWPLVLSSLKTYLETGEGIDIFCGAS